MKSGTAIGHNLLHRTQAGADYRDPRKQTISAIVTGKPFVPIRWETPGKRAPFDCLKGRFAGTIFRNRSRPGKLVQLRFQTGPGLGPSPTITRGIGLPKQLPGRQ